MNLQNYNLLKETKHILRLFNIRPRKSLGQNFVVSRSLISDLINFSSLSSDDIVLEIGAGIGTLTKALAKVARKVIAIEIDYKLIQILKWRLRNLNNVEIIHADVLSIDFPIVNKVVSNLPFSISSPITFKLIENPKFDLAVLTYQREFADRLIAKPGTSNYGRLTVAVNLFAHVEVLKYISRKCFYPEPEVDIAIVKLIPKKKKLSSEEIFLLDLIRWLFTQRNKKLRKPLLNYLLNVIGLNDKTCTKILNKIPYLEFRVRNLSLNQLLEIAKIILEEGIRIEENFFLRKRLDIT